MPTLVSNSALKKIVHFPFYLIILFLALFQTITSKIAMWPKNFLGVDVKSTLLQYWNLNVLKSEWKKGRFDRAPTYTYLIELIFYRITRFFLKLWHGSDFPYGTRSRFRAAVGARVVTPRSVAIGFSDVKCLGRTLENFYIQHLFDSMAKYSLHIYFL